MSRQRSPAPIPAQSSSKRSKEEKDDEPLPSLAYVAGAPTKDLKKLCVLYDIKGHEGVSRVDELRELVTSWLLPAVEESAFAPPKLPRRDGSPAADEVATVTYYSRQDAVLRTRGQAADVSKVGPL